MDALCSFMNSMKAFKGFLMWDFAFFFFSCCCSCCCCCSVEGVEEVASALSKMKFGGKGCDDFGR